MTAAKFFLTTAIDYPNSRPHIGTAFEKLGADVQARYRRMEGADVFFLMGNDENTLKVAKRAAELNLGTQAYCDDMANQFKSIWDALQISYDIFIQTSHERHKVCCRKFIQKVYDNGHIYKGQYEGWYCDGCEEFKSEKQHTENNGLCPNHKTPLTRRAEPCYFFKLSAFQDRLLNYYESNPEFIEPESRRNEIISLIKNEGLQDVNISRKGEEWGIRIPFDEEFTIYVWFDALLTYITGIGYGDDEATFKKYYPADIHFIGKDITRFHCALWPAMLWAADLEAPKKVFGHGFVYIKGEKISKSLGNAIEPMDIITQFSADAFRYYFMRECPFPGDGDFSWDRFREVFNSELANNLGNLLSRCLTLITKNYESVLIGTGGHSPLSPPGRGAGGEGALAGVKPDSTGVNTSGKPLTPNPSPRGGEGNQTAGSLTHGSSTQSLACVPGLDLHSFVAEVRGHVEACRYNQALQEIIQSFLTPTNQYLETNAPWKLVKTDKEAAKTVLFNAVQSLRVASILLKPFIPTSAEAIYRSFNFPKAWEEVKYADAADLTPQAEDLRVTAALVDGKVKPLFPRIEEKK